jgi:hypothetical protein
MTRGFAGKLLPSGTRSTCLGCGASSSGRSRWSSRRGGFLGTSRTCPRLFEPFPRAGGSADFQPDDDGGDAEDGNSQQSDTTDGDPDDDDGDDRGPGVAGKIGRPLAFAEEAPDVACPEVSSAIVLAAAPPLAPEEAATAHDQQCDLNVLHVVAVQSRSIGKTIC